MTAGFTIKCVDCWISRGWLQGCQNDHRMQILHSTRIPLYISPGGCDKTMLWGVSLRKADTYAGCIWWDGWVMLGGARLELAIWKKGVYVCWVASKGVYCASHLFIYFFACHCFSPLLHRGHKVGQQQPIVLDSESWMKTLEIECGWS